MIYNTPSFCATPREIQSIQRACRKMTEHSQDGRRIPIETDPDTNLAYLSNIKNGSQRIVMLNLQDKTDNKARVVIKQGSEKECFKFFSKREAVEYVADALDRLKDMLKR